ncbi:MAG: UDP-N-acetylmuramoyl-L-alanyl-D-glutamate--2,6-diaminopimelate ligase [Bacteroidales bacterium]|nr:UDP-N-acetylmuramoyl-L-alanyl-D-glutamate--2,6-diaminopimelate ligase [Bacteroidales bacterium]
MRNLRDILYKAELLETHGVLDREVLAVDFDSRKVKPGTLFVAVKGLTTDGHLYIDKAIESGATAIVCQEIPEKISEKATIIRVKDSAQALGIIASNFFGNPSEKIRLVGVTGTNGKTTVVTLLHELFTQLGYVCGMISTVRNLIGQTEIPANYTTPDPVQLNELLSQMVEAGCEFAFMEVSSHAVAQQRIAGIHFVGGIFTNLTHDHLDFHKTFSEYLKAKKTFFDQLDAKAFAITNIDDKNGWVMLQNTRAGKKTYSLRTIADFKGKVLENGFAGQQLLIEGREVWCKLVGDFNAYNLLAVYAAARMLGQEPDEVLAPLSSCRPAEGRFDFFTGRDNIIGIVDYAHTPDALENVLNTIGSLRTGTEKLITVVGCGGNRDAAKRPAMAAIAARLSNKLILTSDNPRFEDPEKIIEDMKSGLDPVSNRITITVLNRREAINAACAMANPGDIILVAGKGHEKYQEIKGMKHPFDDKEILLEYLA